MPHHVRITDVAPRDGLQNEPGVIATADKARLIDLLAASGVDEVEVTSFVSAKWIPQLADAPALCSAIASKKPAGIVYSALVPNAKGMAGVIEANAYSVGSGEARAIDKVAVFTAASETFSKKNTNATIAETLERFKPAVGQARDKSLAVRGYISCAIACPFDGPMDPSKVAEVAAKLLALGVHEIDLGDTIGAGTPESIGRLISAVERVLGWVPGLGDRPSPFLLTLHLHDTRGQAADCVRAALDRGVRSFDGAVAGLGGCPFASTPGCRAPGNIATETLVRTVHEAGYATRVDPVRLDAAAAAARRMIAAAPPAPPNPPASTAPAASAAPLTPTVPPSPSSTAGTGR